MRCLLDTHIILWSLEDSAKLPEIAKSLIQNSSNELYFSTASVWEIAIKHEKSPERLMISGQEYAARCFEMGLFSLPVQNHHVFALETLKRRIGSPSHNDPFDRIMLAQAKSDGLKFVTHDSLIPDYNESCVFSV